MSIAFLIAAAAAAASPVTVPPQPQLTEQISQADAELFDLFFNKPCDEPRFRSMIADDVEFYHDRNGVVARSADEFMTSYRKLCSAHSDRAAWVTRRELVASSLTVDPIPGYGAMEAGDHRFFEKHGVNGTEKLDGLASFAMVWVLGPDGKWKLSRVLSFGHHAPK